MLNFGVASLAECDCCDLDLKHHYSSVVLIHVPSPTMCVCVEASTDTDIFQSKGNYFPSSALGANIVERQ